MSNILIKIRKKYVNFILAFEINAHKKLNKKMR